MSTVSPNSLLFVALDVIARNYQTLCHKALEEISTDNGNNIVYYKMVFEDNLSLPPCISEILLRKLLDIQNNIISSDILSLFVDPEVCSLRRLRVGNVLRNESDSNLELFIRLVLKRQELVELDLNSLLEDFDTNYSDSKTAVSLEHLSLSPVINSFALDFILTFNNLKYLDVSDSGIISDKEVGLLASSLYSLESLDLSSTSVESVEVFGVLRMKLKLLSLHDTPLIFRDLPGLLQFTNLEFLDISQSTQVIGTNDLQQNLLKQFLFGSNVLQSLSSLDISGVGEVDDKAMVYFLDSHQNLKFVGLLNVEQTVTNFIPENVEITGDKSLKQLLACLRRYRKRPSFLVKAMRELYGSSLRESLKHDVDQRKVIIKLLLDLMTRYMYKGKKSIMIAASTCLYGYTKEDVTKGSSSLHVSILSEMVSVIIQVLKMFPDDKQIQRNCLLTVYNNYILGDATFDGFLLSKLVLKASFLFHDDNLTGIALDMCAYLSSKISVEETVMLGSLENIKKLLSIINSQVSSNTVDNLLNCALRVVWNLTDEAPKTCQLLVDLNGLSLIIRALQTFDNRSDVLKKILGILNNLAEVVPIRALLLTEGLLSLLRKFLDASYEVDVSYFAAGIISNLADDWPVGLHFACGTREDLLTLMGAAVNQWKKVDKVMVGYRSFKPFIPLLCSHFPDVQLWAIWAIHHVCFHKALRYGKICKDEGILQILKGLWSNPESRLDVQNWAMKAANAIENDKDDTCITE